MCTEDMADMRVYNSKYSVRACKSSSVFDDISRYKERALIERRVLGALSPLRASVTRT